MSCYTDIRRAGVRKLPVPEAESEIADQIIALGEGLNLDRQPAIDAGKLAERVIRQRRQREAVFGKHLFADPCWDMLLDLYISLKKGLRPVSVSSLCIASAVPSTTAMRWIETLIQEGLVFRQSDPKDKRRVFIHLTGQARRQLDDLLEKWAGME